MRYVKALGWDILEMCKAELLEKGNAIFMRFSFFSQWKTLILHASHFALFSSRTLCLYFCYCSLKHTGAWANYMAFLNQWSFKRETQSGSPSPTTLTAQFQLQPSCSSAVQPPSLLFSLNIFLVSAVVTQSVESYVTNKDLHYFNCPPLFSCWCFLNWGHGEGHKSVVEHLFCM